MFTCLEMIWNSDWGRFYIGIVSISNSTPDMSYSAHVFSTALMTHFSDFVS